VSEDQSDLLAFLQDPKNYGPGVGEVHRIDTHCAAVFLVGDRAFKLKKAVRFPYLDFSTREKRKAACEAEIALNIRTAPALYLGLRALGPGADGGIVWDSAEPRDWVVEMRRFPEEALLVRVAECGGLDRALCVALADQIAALHAQAEIGTGNQGIRRILELIDGIEAALAHAGGVISAKTRSEDVIRALRDLANQHAGLIDRRAAAGRVRRCHGDLHLANICLLDGLPILFDALEFDAALATIDVLYDLAFLIMDLEHRGLRQQASLVLNRYLDRRDEADGLPLLPLFAGMRAAIRAYASAAADAKEAAASYLDHAAQCLETVSPVLVAIGGLSGSGKSHLGRRLAPRLGGIGGARHLRSDVIRKGLAGAETPEQRLPPEHYSPAASDLVYAEMRTQAAALLAAGTTVVCDAVFARESERGAVAAVATAARVPFTGLWLEAPPATLEARVARRTGDASDATVAVLDAQIRYDLGNITWHRLETERSGEAVADAAAYLIMPAKAGS
jgi:aminoglycoside phosphotransferase family enzyme/predicted kinase